LVHDGSVHEIGNEPYRLVHVLKIFLKHNPYIVYKPSFVPI
jgi:hypothetical protein